MFKKNEGNVDRIIRAIAALVLVLVSAYALTGILQVIGHVFAVVLAITAATGFCGLYKLIGVSTCPVPVQKQSENITPPSGMHQ